MHNLIIRLSLFSFLVFQGLLWSSPAHAIKVSDSFSHPHAQRINESISAFFKYENFELNDELKLLLEGQRPQKWLEQRVKYVVPMFENRKWYYSLSKAEVLYPSALSLVSENESDLDHREDKPQNNSRALPLMTNIGANLYEIGKKEGKLLTLDVHRYFTDFDNLTITSPRVGLIGVSPHYFTPELYISEEGDQVADTISLISFLFHEARHSDGKAEQLGFPHTLCPDSSDYAGLEVCDEAYNGAYGVSASILKELTKQCEDCTETESEVLMLMYFDFQQRILNNNAMTLEKKEEINDLQNALDTFYQELYYLRKESPSPEMYFQITLIENLVFNYTQRLKILQNTKLSNHTYWPTAPEKILLLTP